MPKKFKKLKDLNNKFDEIFLVVDIETDYRDGTLLQIGTTTDGISAIYHDNWLSFTEYVHKAASRAPNQTLTIIAHNGGKFDWVGLTTDKKVLEKFNISLSFSGAAIVFGRIYNLKRDTAKTKDYGASILIKDSYLLLPSSLKKLGLCFNIPEHLRKLDVDFKEIPELFQNDKPKFFDYLKNDVLSLYTVLKEFQSLMGINFLPATAASLSLKVFRSEYMKNDLSTYEGKADIFFSDSYAGGRTELFRIGDFDNISCFDINSQYPFQMRHRKIGIGIPRYTRKYIKNKTGAYKVEFDQLDTSIPPLLYSKTTVIEEGKEQLVHMHVYKGKGTFCTPEIEEALKIGIKIKFIEGYYFEKSKILFTDFIDYFYSKKEEIGNLDAIEMQKPKDQRITANLKDYNPLYFLYKLILNSLYGKFGEKSEKETLHLGIDAEHEAKLDSVSQQPKLEIDEDGEVSFKSFKNNRPDHRIIHIAAMITSYARVHLFKMLKKFPDHIIYCDTDCIHLKQGATLPPEALHMSELGKWGREYSDFQLRGEYRGKKWYRLIDRKTLKVVARRIKGVPYKTTLTEEQWKHAKRVGNKVSITFEQMTTYKTCSGTHKKPVNVSLPRKRTMTTYNRSCFLKNYRNPP